MKIAITGGIGVGKSEVLKVLEQLGYSVASADEINSRLMMMPQYIEKISMVFPEAVKNGVISRSVLRKIVFNDYDKRQLLNSIAHPIIFDELKNVGDNVFVEVPLLFESGMQEMFDKIILVTAPHDMRINRLFERSGVDKELAEKMINSQLSDSEREKFSDYVIENKASKDELYLKVRSVLQQIFRQ